MTSAKLACFSKPQPPQRGIKVLAIDPGTKNLGVCVFRGNEGRYEEVIETVLFQDTFNLGDMKTYRQWHKKLLPLLDDLVENYGAFDMVVFEEPTEIKGNPVVSSRIWYVYGLIRAWAVGSGVHPDNLRAKTPLQLKDTARYLMRTRLKSQPEAQNPSKEEISKMLRSLGIPTARSSHENDATLAALAVLGRKKSQL